MIKPLYLTGSEGLGLRVLLDGPALRVAQKGRADGRYPLVRLSRVVVSGPVEWRTDALLVAIERGITVTFLDENGDPRAFCLGCNPQAQSLSDRLFDLLDRPDWEPLYANWRDANVRLRILDLGRGLGVSFQDLRARSVRAELEQLLGREAPPDAVHRGLSLLQGWHHGLTLEQFNRMGLQAGTLPSAQGSLKLTRDCASIVGWDLYVPLRDTLARLARKGRPVDFSSPIQRLCLLRAFEQRAPRLRKLHRELLERLARWLREV